MAWYDEVGSSGNFITIKEGEVKRLHVDKIEKSTKGKADFFLKIKDENNPGCFKNVGYNYLLTTKDGRVLTIASWSLLKALSNAKVDSGMKIEINHKKKGEYIIMELAKDTVINGDDIPF